MPTMKMKSMPTEKFRSRNRLGFTNECVAVKVWTRKM
jgi:hypothetical protein